MSNAWAKTMSPCPIAVENTKRMHFFTSLLDEYERTLKNDIKNHLLEMSMQVQDPYIGTQILASFASLRWTEYPGFHMAPCHV